MNISALDPRDGGPPNAVPSIAAALAAKGHDVHVVATRIAGTDLAPAYSLAAEAGVHFHFATRKQWGRFRISFGHLLRTLRVSSDADLISVHGFYQAVAVCGYLAAIRNYRRRPIFAVQPHGVFETYQEAFSHRPKRIYMLLVGRLIVRRADVIFAASLAEERSIRSTLGQKIPVRVTGLGVRITPASRARWTDRESVQGRTILFLSRIAPKKRLDLLISACASAVGTDREFSVIVAGDGDAEFVEQLRRSAAGLPVTFVGHVTGARREEIELGAALFVLPSENENFGQAVTEAMSAGIPVITTDQVGAHTHVHAAQAGWVLSELTPASLATTIEEALSDPCRLRDMGRRAQRYALENLDWSSVARAWEDSYSAKIGV